MRKLHLGATAALAFIFGGCGILADTVSDEFAGDFDSDVIDPDDSAAEFATPVAPISFAVSVDQSNPTYSFPGGTDTLAYSATLQSDILLGSNDFRIGASNFAFSSDGDDPVEFSVLVKSAEDQYVGQDFGFEPTQPTSCTFSLDPATDGASEYSAAMTTCIRDFADTNGVPLNLTYTVNTRSLTSQNAPGDYSVSHIEQMESEVEISHGFKRTFLDDIDSDVVRNLDFAEFNSLTMAGYGFSSETVNLTGLVMVHDAYGNLAALGFLQQTIQGGQIYSIFTRFDELIEDKLALYSYSGNVNPTLIPGSPAFERNILAAAATNLDRPSGSFGASAIAWWHVKGGFPRVGEIGIKIVGNAQPGLPSDPIQVPEGGEYVYWDPDTGFTFREGVGD